MTAVAGALCARCGSPLEPGDLRCAICSLPVPVPDAASQSLAVEVLRCEGCGAALEYDVRVAAPRCAFCGSITHLERSSDPIERAQAFLPFRVDPRTADQCLRAWLGKQGFFRPSDLASAATLHSLTPLWWVGWTFDCEALVSWTADSDYGAGRSRWAPHAGQSPISLKAVLVSASRGLSQKETTKLASGFDLASAATGPHEMPGVVIERFDVQRSTARATVAQAVKNSSAAHASHWIPGSRYRNLHVSVLLRQLVTRRFAFPSYVLAYRYRDKLYRAIVHGQNAQLVFGTTPLSWFKVVLVVLGGLLGVGLLLLVLAALAYFAART